MLSWGLVSERQDENNPLGTDAHVTISWAMSDEQDERNESGTDTGGHDTSAEAGVPYCLPNPASGRGLTMTPVFLTGTNLHGSTSHPVSVTETNLHGLTAPTVSLTEANLQSLVTPTVSSTEANLQQSLLASPVSLMPANYQGSAVPSVSLAESSLLGSSGNPVSLTETDFQDMLLPPASSAERDLLELPKFVSQGRSVFPGNRDINSHNNLTKGSGDLRPPSNYPANDDMNHRDIRSDTVLGHIKILPRTRPCSVVLERIDQAVKREVLDEEQPAKKVKRCSSKPVENDVIILDDDPSPSVAADNFESYYVTLNNPSSFVCLPCFWCEATFSDPQQLQAHLIAHSCCVICDAQFTDIKNLNAHSATHPSDKQMQCLLCGVTYFRIQKTEEHAAMHDGHDVFECTSCKRYISSSDCRNHMLTACQRQERRCEAEIPIPGTVVITPITQYVQDTGCMDGGSANDMALTSTAENIYHSSVDDSGNRKKDHIDPVACQYSVDDSEDSSDKVLYSVDVNLVSGSNLQPPVNDGLEERKGDIKRSLGNLFRNGGTNVQYSTEGHPGGHTSDKCGTVEDSKSNVHYSLLGQRDEQSRDAKRAVDDHAPAGSSAASLESQGSATNVKVERQEDCEVIAGLNPPPENPLQCLWCELVLEDLVALQDHLLGHCRCVVCDQRFSSVGELGQHMLQHPGNKFMRCVICGTLCYRSSDVVAHTARNNRHVFYECTLCGILASSNVREHMAVKCAEKINPSDPPALGESATGVTQGNEECVQSDPYITSPGGQQDQTQTFILPLPQEADYSHTGMAGDLPGLPEADGSLSPPTDASPKPALDMASGDFGLPDADSPLSSPTDANPKPALDMTIAGLGLPDADGSPSPPTECNPWPVLDSATGILPSAMPATCIITRLFTPVGVDETALRCNYCLTVFTVTMNAVRLHLQKCYVTTVPQTSTCFECGSLFRTEYLLMKHRKGHHIVTQGTKRLRCRFRCLYCSMEFRHRRSLRLHVDTVHV